MVSQLLFLVHVVVTYVMAGVMWFVQLAYYPNLAVVGRDAFVDYQREHIRRITRIAWTMLCIELLTGVLLAAFGLREVSQSVLIVNALLIAGIWASTWFIQVPLHRRLEEGWDAAVHARLVGSNWLRTCIYTGRGLLVLYVLWRLARS